MDSLFTLKILTDITRVGRIAVLCYDMVENRFSLIGRIPEWIPEELAKFQEGVDSFFEHFFHPQDKSFFPICIEKMKKGIEFDWERVRFKGKELNFTYISFYYRVYPDEIHPLKGYALLVDLTELREIEVERKMQDAISKQFLMKLEQKNKIIQEQKELLQKANAELEAQKATLEELNHTKDKLFSVIGHDLRSPIHSVLGLMDLLELEIIEESEIKNYIAKLRYSVAQTSELLNNLLLWAKNQLSGLHVCMEPVNLKKMFLDKYNLLKYQFNKNQLIYDTIHEDCYVLADANMLSVVIQNLLSNAAKFTPDGGTIKITAEENPEKKTVLVKISDNGVGMSEETKKKIFGIEYFSTRGTKGEGGAGLGLKICQEFLKQNKSELIIESQEGQGTTMSFELPLAEKNEKNQDSISGRSSVVS
ncbi:MAG: HAMP domain-containing histidine kinase [Cytophagales bacterium]|nr:HAMP domain-containing histidine kinase [Cytophagales bacterium]MDW8384187.1 HAMP domain-containing sensor histidine kinase [Flammeovirgaceae bacterium]